MLYDLMHLEDDEDHRKPIERYSNINGLSYLGLSCLQALTNALPNSQSKIFVVDGSFPRVDHGAIEPLAPEAITLIRKAYHDARIVLCSSAFNIESIARSQNVEYVEKKSARYVIDRLTAMLAETSP